MSRTIRGALALVLGAAMLGVTFTRTPAVSAAPEQCFPETNHCIQGIFMDYWQQHGGLAVNGYPLTDQRLEALEDGQSYTLQYFERVRLEYHPEKAQQFQVLLGQFGRSIHPADPPVAASGAGTFFAATGHNVPPDFLAYWNANGGLAQFGYPLTEVISETLNNAQGQPQPFEVQYFERARFERHPENQAPYDILLGQFGRQVLAQAAPLNLAACTAGNLAVSSEGDAGAGQRYATVYLTNTGAQPCSLSGTPQAQLLDQTLAPLDVTTQSNDQAPVNVIVLPPSEIADFGLRWSNWCGANPGKARVRVTLPNGGGTFTTDAPGTPPCLGAGQGSTFSINPFGFSMASAHANVVLRYYTAINARDYQSAYNLLGTSLQAQQSYDAFVAGYANTTGVAVMIGAINGANGPETNRVAVTLVATQTGGGTQTFTGYYDVGADGGALKIINASIAAGQ
jgi:hypothetical protein